MYQFRPFHNADPPHLVEIWNQQPRQRGVMQPTSVGELEQLVFAKQYFDRQGLIVATRDGRPVGFVHVGFGPDETGADLDTSLGVTCMLMVRPEEAEGTLAAELLSRGEDHLRACGAKVLYAGGINPLSPFYLGLYGGAELPGILDSDARRQMFFRAHGYEEIDRVRILQCELGRFRPPVDRHQLRLRRCMELSVCIDPPSRNWWEASTWAALQRIRFDLTLRGACEVQARVMLWDIEPLASSWGVRAAGLIELEVDTTCRRQGMATFLMGEALRQIYAQGIGQAEVQVMHNNQPAIALYHKLGFTEIDQGAVLRKAAR